MDQNTQVDVSTLLRTIAGQLSQNRGHLNAVDGAGTHGERMASAFEAAAQAAANAGTNDAGQQLAVAAQAMKQQGQGKATQFYANGLAQAAAQFKGQSGISLGSLMSFLQSFLGGVQHNNPAKPGQGTMLDALGPAVSAFQQARQAGLSIQQAMMRALTAAISGAQSTGNGGTPDPGAASATNVLGGIFTALAPGLIGGLVGGHGQGSTSAPTQPGGIPGIPGGLGGLFGGLLGRKGQVAGDPANDPTGGLGGLLGGLMGGGQESQGSQGSNTGWLGGLLGGMMHQGQTQSGQGGFLGTLGEDIGKNQ